MPYASLAELPEPIRHRLPLGAQHIFLAAFNSAWEGYGDGDLAAREQRAFRIAWSAVKRCYRKTDGGWVRKHPAHAQ